MRGVYDGMLVEKEYAGAGTLQFAPGAIENRGLKLVRATFDILQHELGRLARLPKRRTVDIKLDFMAESCLQAR